MKRAALFDDIVDLVVGTPTANRRRGDVGGIMGFVVNTLTLEDEVGRRADRLRVAAAGTRHGPAVVELVTRRAAPRTPLFQTMLAWVPPMEEMMELPGVTVRLLPMPFAPVKFARAGCRTVRGVGTVRPGGHSGGGRRPSAGLRRPRPAGQPAERLAAMVADARPWPARFGATPGEAASASSSIGFDASVHELLLPLTTGAEVHLVPEELRGDPAALMRWLGEHQVVQAFLPPATYGGSTRTRRAGWPGWRFASC